MILDPKTNLVLVVKCTHHWVRQNNQNDYLIWNWKNAGLNEESVLMLDYPLEIEMKDLKYKIGHLD